MTIRTLMCASAIPLTLSTVTASASENHCSPQEQVIFSCAIKHSSKVVSLCATKPLAKGQGSLAYRFGSIGKIELQFPTIASGSLNQFRHAHYFRYQTDRTEISFTSGKFTYSVFDYYEGDNKPDYFQGVRVVDQNGRETDLACSGKAISHLQKLEGVVPCDEDNALATCN